MSRVHAHRSAFVLIAVVAVSAAKAGTIYVDDSATGPTHNGTSWCNAFLDLQDALAVAQPGDEIQVAAGLYTPDRGTGDRLATFRLKSRVTLLGGYAGCGASNPSARDVSVYLSILSGDLSANDGPNFANYADNSYHVVSYSDGSAVNVVLDGFTVAAGCADGTGPAGTITNQGSAVHIRNDAFKCIPGGPTLRNCTIRNNWSLHHGAVNDHAAGSLFENCTFRDNFAGEEGAGLLVHEGKATVVLNCTFERNVTNNEGGGVWTGMDNDPTCPGVPAPTFTGCRFVQNQGYNGGGFFAASYSQPRLSGCFFESNVANFTGGGVHLEFGSIVIENTSFIDNTTTANNNLAGGGGAWLNTVLPDAKAVLTDCEFRGNSGRTGGGLFAPLNSVLQVTRGLFMENVAGQGGGLWYGGTTLVTDSMFLRNHAAALGGALASDQGGRLTLRRTSLIQNRVLENAPGGGGGGLSLYGGSAEIANCWFLGNTFDATSNGLGGGGLLVNAGGVAAISNSAFSRNTARTGGAACFSNEANVRVANCTFVQNTGLYRGDGIATWDSTVTVDNSILWDDMPGGSGIDLYAGTGSQVSCAYTCIRGGWSGSGNFSADPSLLNAPGYDGIPGTADDNLYLPMESPCVDAGDNGRLPADKTDLDDDGNVIEPIPHDLSNHARVYGSVVDLGALEASISPCDPGTFSATGQQPCDPCPAGQFQPNAGATTCTPCTAGTHAPSPGAGACTPCAAGTYQPSPGAIACLPCAPGTMAPGSGSATCTACPTGSYQPASGGTACLPCGCDDADPCTTNGCDAVNGDCAFPPIPGCSIPTVSDWGLTILSLLLMISATVVTGRAARANS